MKPAMMTRAMQVTVKRRYAILILFILAGLGIFLGLRALLPSPYPISYFPPKALELYFDAEKEYGVSWMLLAAADLEGKRDLEQLSRDHISRSAEGLSKAGEDKKTSPYAARLKVIDRVFKDKVFPIGKDSKYSYEDGWGDKRNFGGDRKHEGTDIICAKGTPIYSVGDGVVEKKGWNQLGGWRLGIRGNDGMYYYYAHMSKYAPNMKSGRRIKKGELIGYVGDSGYGPEGTVGKFVPHLHFGIYEKNDKAVSPYPFLKAWDKN